MRRHTYKLSYRTIKENETVTLYWITSPVTDIASGAKTMTVFFKAGKEIIPVEMPWGSLPLMKIGCDYRDGRMISKGAWPAQGELVIKNNRNARIAKAYDCIPANLYSLLDASPKAGFEKCYCFQNNGVTYVIPCIELVRALYGDKRFFVDRILTSDGLEGLTHRRNGRR